MTREEFLKLCGILGIGLPLQSSIKSCSENDEGNPEYPGKIIIIGAGAGGLSSGYLLNQLGIDFEILEASSGYGGRMKRTLDFADFPIPLGAEWLHTSPDVFQEIVNDAAVSVDVGTVGYKSNDTVAFWDNGKLTVSQERDSDRKFVNSTWFDFYDEYIVPSIAQKIKYNTVVDTINYSGDQVIINAQNEQYVADRVIISVPLKILQDGDISFIPVFPDDKLEAINEINIWEGFKAFIEFTDKFYHTATAFNITPETDGQKLYYDASYGQNTSKNILGFFCVGKPALDYINRTGDDLRNFMLSELDEIYDNQASAGYIKHIVQNWNNEPFIKAAYISDHTNWRTVRKLSEPVAGKVFFAGGPYTDGNDWVAVHAAAQSAREAVVTVTKA